MNITDVKITLLQSGNTLALASVTFNNQFAVTGIKVMNGKKGLFVAMPQRKDKNGNYHSIAFPTTKEFRKHLEQIIINEFNRVRQQFGYGYNNQYAQQGYGYGNQNFGGYNQQNQGFSPQQGFVPQQGFAPQQGFTPQQGYPQQNQGWEPQQVPPMDGNQFNKI